MRAGTIRAPVQVPPSTVSQNSLGKYRSTLLSPILKVNDGGKEK